MNDTLKLSGKVRIIPIDTRKPLTVRKGHNTRSQVIVVISDGDIEFELTMLDNNSADKLVAMVRNYEILDATSSVI